MESADPKLRLSVVVRSWIPSLVCALALALVLAGPATRKRSRSATRIGSAASSSNGNSESSENSDPIVIRKQVQEVQLLFSVTDNHGHPVNDLKPDQIKVVDSGQPVSRFTTFTHASSLPLRIAILVDGSDSMLKNFGNEERAANSVLNGILNPERDRAYVSVFSAQREPPPSQAGTLQLRPAHFQSQTGGRTALFDVLISASQHPIMTVVESRPVQRVLVLFSDGEDNYSFNTLDDAIAALQHNQIVVYAVAVHSHHLEYPGDKVLRRLGSATGGKAFILAQYDQMADVLGSIAREVRTQYVVGFKPVANASRFGFHPVNIIAESKHHVSVHARNGYYIVP